jgi:hypothetical protein
MSKYYRVDGYWKDTKEKFENYIVKETHDIDIEHDDSIFFYGMDETGLNEMIQLGENTFHDFVLTSFKETIL